MKLSKFRSFPLFNMSLLGRPGKRARLYPDNGPDDDDTADFTRLEFLTQSAVPSVPDSTLTTVYADDGTNRRGSTPGLRYYDGTQWDDIMDGTRLDLVPAATAVANPVEGTVYWDDGTNRLHSEPGLRGYNGSAWVDYWSGTDYASWTPTLEDAASGAVTYTTQVGTMFNVGAISIFHGRITWSGVGTMGSGNLKLGLPMTGRTIGSAIVTCNIGYYSGFGTVVGLGAAGANSNNYVSLYTPGAGASTIVAGGSLSGAGALYFSGTVIY